MEKNGRKKKTNRNNFLKPNKFSEKHSTYPYHYIQKEENDNKMYNQA